MHKPSSTGNKSTRCATVRSATVVVTLAVALLGPALLSTRAHAQPCADLGEDCPVPLDWESARGLGLGYGVRASAASSSALMYNPAGLVLGGVYHIEGNGDYFANSGTVALGAAVTDSATSRLAGGFGIRGFLSGKDGYKGIDGRLSLAFPFSDAFSIGLGGRYVNVEQEVEQPDGDVRQVDVAEGITLDASLRFQVDVLAFSLAAYNIVDQDSPLMPVTVGFSTALMPIEELIIGFDLLGDMSNHDNPELSVGGGIEFLAADVVPLRGGYSFDAARKLHRLGLGIGYTDKLVGVDLGVRRDLAGGDETRVMLALRYYLQ